MSEPIFCRKCGATIDATTPTCTSCGAVQPAPSGAKYRSTAALLAIFLGALGVHRFYLGQWWGLFYLLFCWTGIPGLIALVEGLAFAFGSQENWDRKYNKGFATKSSGAAIAIGIAVAVLGGIFLIGILAAISLPAYQDYTIRARTQEAYIALSGTTPSVDAYIAANRGIPPTLEAAGVTTAWPKSVASVTIDAATGEIRATLTGPQPIAGKSISMVPSGPAPDQVKWKCVSDIQKVQYLPKNCRP